mgnify:CR=1 FL=1
MAKNKSDVLLLFSGGLDSTGAFWKLMQDKRNIHVYHLHLNNKEHRNEAEAIAVKSIVEYMKQFGDFEYSESTHIYPTYRNSFIWDSDITSFMAGTVCQCLPWIKEIALGRTASDDEEVRSMTERRERGNKILEALCDARKIYPVMDLTKKQIWDMLPQNLRTLIWSCRTPVYKNNDILPCGKCITCESMKNKKIIHPRIQTYHNQSSQPST